MKNNNQAYSIIIVIVLIGFMILLTTGVFRLVLNEMKDNTSIGNYAKAYFWAEAAQELALLHIKEQGYGFNEGLNVSEILKKDATENDMKGVKISYTNDGKTKKYEGTLASQEYHIMPLFIIDTYGNEQKIEDYTLTVEDTPSKLSWNILGTEAGLAGTGDTTNSWAKTSVDAGGSILYANVSTWEFLADSETNYLILYNNAPSEITYTIESSGEFTKPISTVISTATVGDYKQNIKTEINYADIVKRANYSIYSGG